MWQHKPASRFREMFQQLLFKMFMEDSVYCPLQTKSQVRLSLSKVQFLYTLTTSPLCTFSQHNTALLSCCSLTAPSEWVPNPNHLFPSVKFLLSTPPENSRFLPSPSPAMPNYRWRRIFSGHTLNMISKLRHFTVRTHYILYVHLIFQSKSYLLFSSSHYSVAYQADFTFLMLLFSFMLHIHTVLRWQNIHLLLHC